MSNPLTGNYEAVVEVAVRQINGLLGSLHQNGAIENAVLKLLHSATLRVGDPPRKFPEVLDFGDWLLDRLKKGPPGPLKEVRAGLTATAPPGAAKMLTDAFAQFDDDWQIELPPDVVRGLAKMQLSTVTIAVANGSSSEITVNARVRAHYYPDPNTTALPAPLHGDLSAAFDVRKASTPSATRLTITPSPQDAKIQFLPAPGSGLDAVETSRIAAEIRKVLRQGATQTPVDLPSDFPFAEFKGLGSGANQVIALPAQLSGAAPPAGGAQALTQSFIGSSGFALAVSKEYVSSLIDIEAIRESMRQQSVTLRVSTWLGSVSVTFSFHFSQGPTLTFKNGGFEISGRVEAVSDSRVVPNGWVSFKQLIHLTLNSANQSIRLVRAGEPDVDESLLIPHSTALNTVRSEVDKALAANSDGIKSVFDGGKTKLQRALRTFDPSATVSFTAIEVTTAGVIVRGEISSAARRAPVVKVKETHRGTAFTAFESWIPAGRIHRFIWSWVEYSDPTTSIFSGTQKTLTAEHEFILPKPVGVTSIDRICLRIEGMRIAPSGQAISIAAGTMCQLLEPEFALDLPSWWGPLTLPIWQPDLKDASALRDAIAGHVGVQADGPAREPSSRNTVVYFADWASEKPLDDLGAALSKIRNPALNVIVVLPVGAFDRSRREFEGRLPRDGLRASVQFTEDDEGAWTRVFAVAKAPCSFLVNAKREFVWKQEGAVDAAALATLLDKHPVRTRPLEFRPLQLTVSPGDAMIDTTFDDDRAQAFSLHRFRGREAILNFWQSWSSPCLKELARLQLLYATAKDRPFIVAFHGGSNSKALDEIRKRLGLSYSLVHDAQQRIARQYGVRCWPSTIMIDGDGHVQHIQLGTEHAHDQQPVRKAD
jgi:peroxiredoxin